MVIRLVMLNGSLPGVREALLRGADLSWRVALEIVHWIAVLLPIAPLVVILIWSCGHDARLRRRIAEEGCPYLADADAIRLPGQREREFRSLYC